MTFPKRYLLYPATTLNKRKNLLWSFFVSNFTNTKLPFCIIAPCIKLATFNFVNVRFELAKKEEPNLFVDVFEVVLSWIRAFLRTLKLRQRWRTLRSFKFQLSNCKGKLIVKQEQLQKKILQAFFRFSSPSKHCLI